MAVVDIRDVSTGNCDIGEDGHRTYTRTIHVWFNTNGEAGITAILASGISYAEAYQFGGEFDAAAKCRSIRAEKVADRHYNVIAEYTTNYEGEGYENPTDEPPQVSGGTSLDKDEAFVEDVETGDAVLNSAKQPFQEQPTRRRRSTKFTIKKNSHVNPEDFAYLYVGRRNDGAFRGYGDGTVLCTNITYDKQWAIVQGNRVAYWPTTYEFEVDSADEWKVRPIDQGFKELNDDGELVNIKVNGEDIAEPCLLDGNGHKLEPDDDPVFLEYVAYLKTDFGPLDLEGA